MWETMQSAGYFSRHPDYEQHFGVAPDAAEQALDRQLLTLDYSADEFVFPVPYSPALERSVKRTEAFWLPRMFSLPDSGAALDVGCGYGRTVAWLSDCYQQVTGTDISATAIAAAKKFLAQRSNITLLTNEANGLPASLMENSFALVYAFTVFQHIPREFTRGLLKDIQKVLKADGCVIFNLLSGINEDRDDGVAGTEWAIGYSLAQARALLTDCGLVESKIVRWSGPGTDVSWLWVQARKQ